MFGETLVKCWLVGARKDIRVLSTNGKCWFHIFKEWYCFRPLVQMSKIKGKLLTARRKGSGRDGSLYS